MINTGLQAGAESIRGSTHRVRTGGRAFITNRAEIIAILILRQSVDNLFEVGLRDEAHSQRDLLQARDLQALPMLDGGDVIAGFE